MSIIPEHFSSGEIHQLKLKMESNNWISLLKFFEREMDFYASLLSSENFKKCLSETDFGGLLEQIHQCKIENSLMLRKTVAYKNQVDGLLECEDSACDLFYLNDHEKFRNEMEAHKKGIHDLKNTIFEAVESKF